MTAIRELLVPLDGTPETLSALRVAGSIADLTRLAVSAVTVCSPNADTGPDRAWLDEQARRIGLTLRRTVVTPGLDVPAGVLEAAQEPGSVICLSSHGRSGLAELVLGSESNEIVRRKTGPMLLVGPEVRPVRRFEKLMVCHDGSPVADSALSVAADLALDLGMSVRLVRVVDPDSMGPSDLDDDDALRQAASDLEARGLVVDWQILFRAAAARTLVMNADEADVDLLVAGTHGRTGLRSVTMGSVANGIVRHAHQPVLVVHPADGQRS